MGGIEQSCHGGKVDVRSLGGARILRESACVDLVNMCKQVTISS